MIHSSGRTDNKHWCGNRVKFISYCGGGRALEGRPWSFDHGSKYRPIRPLLNQKKPRRSTKTSREWGIPKPTPNPMSSENVNFHTLFFFDLEQLGRPEKKQSQDFLFQWKKIHYRRRLLCSPSGIMSYLIWNYQGPGGPWTIRYLQDLVRKHNPLLFFLIETKCNAKKLESIKRSLEMYGVNVDSKGKSGGLALLWSTEVFVNLMGFSSNHIDARVRLYDTKDYWRFIGFYVASDAQDRH
ncbi:UNVERIFIED_CONTAM: hypothetical protein Sradi_4423700 [Sesamum radiatum]|uniref:Uncharacterized protein n=1 Tax=Sesamum radiatum TaxID=300843 RepID=A0AAW2NTK5_SESRA